jgi:hypothetical protein
MADPVRISQEVVEYATETSAAVRVSQVAVETLTAPVVGVRISQFIIEYIPLAPTPPAPETTRHTIRRLRRAPHLADEQVRIRHDAFQLDLEAGKGLTTGQGSDPELMLRFSDDGGHTWSQEYRVSAGPKGEYRKRAIWRRLGTSRDRVYEITISDPIKVAWLDAYLTLTKGTS